MKQMRKRLAPLHRIKMNVGSHRLRWTLSFLPRLSIRLPSLNPLRFSPLTSPSLLSAAALVLTWIRGVQWTWHWAPSGHHSFSSVTLFYRVILCRLPLPLKRLGQLLGIDPRDLF